MLGDQRVAGVQQKPAARLMTIEVGGQKHVADAVPQEQLPGALEHLQLCALDIGVQHIDEVDPLCAHELVQHDTGDIDGVAVPVEERPGGEARSAHIADGQVGLTTVQGEVLPALLGLFGDGLNQEVAPVWMVLAEP